MYATGRWGRPHRPPLRLRAGSLRGGLPEVTPWLRGLPQRHAAVMRDEIRDVIRDVIRDEILDVIRDVIRDVIGRRKGGARSGQRVLIHTHTHTGGGDDADRRHA